MIIKDLEGKKLSLTKTQLRELSPGESFFIFLEDLRSTRGAVLHMDMDICWDHKPGNRPTGYTRVTANKAKHTVGCHKFAPEVFAKILKAA